MSAVPHCTKCDIALPHGVSAWAHITSGWIPARGKGANQVRLMVKDGTILCEPCFLVALKGDQLELEL